MLELGRKDLKSLQKKFKMPCVPSKYCIGIKTSTEGLNPLPGYVAVMINICDLRMIIVGTGLFPLGHFFMLLNLRYMLIADQRCAFETNLTVVSTCYIFGLYHSEVPGDKNLIPFKRNLYSRKAHSRLYWCSIHNPKLKKF